MSADEHSEEVRIEHNDSDAPPTDPGGQQGSSSPKSEVRANDAKNEAAKPSAGTDSKGDTQGGGDQINQNNKTENANVGGNVNQLTISGNVRDIIYEHFVGSDKVKVGEASFQDITYNLPPWTFDTPQFISQEIESHLADLKREHIIFISCPHHEFALAAINALIGKLNFPDAEQKKWCDLDAEFKRTDKEIRKVQSFLPEEVEGVAAKATAIYVRAFYSSAKDFVSEQIGAFDRYNMFTYTLKKHGVYLLWFVESSYIDELSGRVKISCWKLPFLRPLLEKNFPEDPLKLEQTLLRQWGEKKWGKDEGEFCGRIVSCLDNDQLLDQIKRLDDPKPVPFKSIFMSDDHIMKAVFCIAACLRDLAPHEFCEAVEYLLIDRKVRTPIPDYRISISDYRLNSDECSGEPSKVMRARCEVPIVDVWRDNKDEVMSEWLRETYSSKGSDNVIDFSDPTLRENVRKFLREDRRFFLKDQFTILQKNGFLFHPSNRVADSVIKFTIAMMTHYPSEYGKEWLADLIITFKDRDEPKQRDEPAIYARIADLMRVLLKNPRMKDIVDGCFAELMRLRSPNAILGLIKRLKSVPEIDEYHWIKKLFDQGDPVTRLRTYDYFSSSIKKLGARIFEPDSILEKWIPKKVSLDDRYPISSKYALCSLLRYCVETAGDLKTESYGCWPSQYPLFAFKDSNTAEKNLNKLVTWLFHPAMKQALKQFEQDRGEETYLSANQWLGYLIAKWFFIILGPHQKTSDINGKYLIEASCENESVLQSDPSLNAANLVDILLKQISLTVDNTQTKELKKYWELEQESFAYNISITEYGDKLNQLRWQNRRLGELKSKFKNLIAAKKSSADSAALAVM